MKLKERERDSKMTEITRETDNKARRVWIEIERKIDGVF